MPRTARSPTAERRDPNNTREILRDFSRPRGTITSADGVVLARSVPSGDSFLYQREIRTDREQRIFSCLRMGLGSIPTAGELGGP